MIDYDAMSAADLSRYARDVLGREIDPETIRKRRRQKKRGEALLKPMRRGRPRKDDRPVCREDVEDADTWHRLIRWKRPEGIDELLEQCST